MKKIFTLSLILSSSLIYSQKELNATDVDKFCYKFKIENEKIVGNSYEILNNRISKSQFVLLGENHFVSEISLFTNSLIPMLAKNNFKYFIAEIGPNSVKKLVSEIQKKGQLFDFNTKNHELTGEIPIPFFDGKEDELFLKTALKNNFKISGIDQEYLSSQFFLFEEILELSKNKKTITPAYQIATGFMLSEFKEFWKDPNHKVFEKYINSKEINTFFELTNKENTQIQAIISDLKISWQIYRLYQERLGKESNNLRIQNMKTNFSKYYKETAKKDDLPKMFVKMGAAHLSNGLSIFGYYDLGNMIKELSHFNQTTSTSILCMSRFRMKDNQITDELSAENPLNIILEKGNKEEWTLINNVELLNYCYKEKINVNSELKKELERFDFILIPPVVHPMKMNYKK
jgi:hypothetical protein